jgi:hypothetical protein
MTANSLFVSTFLVPVTVIILVNLGPIFTKINFGRKHFGQILMLKSGLNFQTETLPIYLPEY